MTCCVEGEPSPRDQQGHVRRPQRLEGLESPALGPEGGATNLDITEGQGVRPVATSPPLWL